MNNLKWYYGRDLRKLTDIELEDAYMRFAPRAKKSRLSQYAWQNIISEINRRRNAEIWKARTGEPI
jgi:hypothetical protein